MSYIMRNDKGQTISGKRKLLKQEYGTGEFYQNGDPVVNWKLLSIYADENGFDKRNVEENSEYIINVVLPYGTILIRYGNEVGVFSAPKGTEYEKLALPYEKDTLEYNEYKVIGKGIRVLCVVKKGRVAPGFGSNGGAIQFMHPMTIREAVKKKILERIY